MQLKAVTTPSPPSPPPPVAGASAHAGERVRPLLAPEAAQRPRNPHDPSTTDTSGFRDPYRARPARERVRPLLAADVRDAIPDVVLDARIGRGTVASEFDRAIRVRLEGDGPPSARELVPETTTTQRLLASDAGPAFERLVRGSAAVADAAGGADNLRSYTLLPDEHAAKAVQIMTFVSKMIREGVEPQFSQKGTPAAERAGVREFVGMLAKDVPSEVRFSAGWNGEGHVVVAPDGSRNVLATIGAYRPATGDSLLRHRPKVREAVVRDDWDTLVHETHHSVSPQPRGESETTSIFEEATASMFARREWAQVARGAAARVNEVAERPRRASDRANLDWKPWSRDHLPAPPQDLVDTAEGRYIDGPEVLRGLVRLAGIDMRTTAGKDRAFEILQGRAAAHAPRRLADAIIERHGIAREHREDVVERVRASVQHERGAKLVTELLEELKGSRHS